MLIYNPIITIIIAITSKKLKNESQINVYKVYRRSVILKKRFNTLLVILPNAFLFVIIGVVDIKSELSKHKLRELAVQIYRFNIISSR